MAWLLAIFLIPFIGIVLFLLIGNVKLPKKWRVRQTEVNRLITERSEGVDLAPDRSTWPTWFATIVEQNRRLGALPALGGNTATLIGDYQASIDAMTADVDTAERFVHVEFFIVSLDDTTRGFFAAMERAVQRGVVVRVLLDHISTGRSATHKATYAELDRIGAKWSFMLPGAAVQGQVPATRPAQPPQDRGRRRPCRLHRLAEPDRPQLQLEEQHQARAAVAGARGAHHRADRHGAERRVPLGLVRRDRRVSSPTTRTCRATVVPFDTSPDALDCQIVPSGPAFDGENNLRLFLSLVNSAQQRVIITSPYFVPDEAMMYAITSARLRGLEVQLFVSEIGDQGSVWHAQRSYYGALLRAGVQIWLYPGPYILHAKHLSIDDDVAVIGSSNMDIRSFNLNFEVCMLVRGPSFVADMRKVEEGYRTVGRRLTLEEWEQEPATATFLDGIARLTSALQ